MFRLQKKSSLGPRLRDSRTCILILGIQVLDVSVATALRYAGDMGSWRPFLGKPESIVITAMLSEHLPCACVPSFYITVTSWAGVSLSLEQMSNLPCKGVETHPSHRGKKARARPGTQIILIPGLLIF